MSALPHCPVCWLPKGCPWGCGAPTGKDGPSSLLHLAAPHDAFAICRTERQYRDLAYCVSQLPLTERGLRRMLDNFDCFGDKLSDESIFSAFLSIVGKLRRGAKPEGKVSAAAIPVL